MIGSCCCAKKHVYNVLADKGKMWEDEQDGGGGSMDELLAVLGYKVKSFDMADMAQKLEQLEMVIGFAQEDGISHLGEYALRAQL